MIRRLARSLCLPLALSVAPLAPAPLLAEEVVAGLSQNRIAIDTTFTGSEILVFGAVKREEPIAEAPPLQVIVTLEGPQEELTVRRKSRVAGIWVNTDQVDVDHAPSYYAVATTAPLREVLTDTEDLRNSITINRAIRSVGATIEGAPSFVQALVRLREDEGAYELDEGAVELAEDTLFRTRFRLPANLREGDYRARIFLTRGGRIVDAHETVVDVRKVGLERWLFVLSREQPALYGLLALMIAALAGYAASAGFAWLRR
ncbi:TIGR02186 family protein [Frigidibacter sp. MR17.24]|uniref:TIGR02186 family protein n=1 Tax=Frigidibacter sp. MR17.24 TaxID=3127345 RepID=UPI0030129FAD